MPSKLSTISVTKSSLIGGPDHSDLPWERDGQLACDEPGGRIRSIGRKQVIKFSKGFLGLAVAASLACGGDALAQEKHKIFLSMSYIGNDWQAVSSNMIRAMASSKALRDKVDLEVQVAGPNAQKQIQQINAMVQAGADAILVFPISPTALNQVVKAA